MKIIIKLTNAKFVENKNTITLRDNLQKLFNKEFEYVEIDWYFKN